MNAPSPLHPDAEAVIAMFENHWRAGARPCLLEAVGRCPPAGRPAALRELVHAELEFRLKAREAATADEYLDRFPELAGDRAAAAGLRAAEAELRARAEDTAAGLSDTGGVGPADPDDSPAPGTEIGGFRVVAPLGAGGMGVVVAAEDVRLRRRVALKRMRADVARHPQAKARFLREARSMAAVESDFVVPVLHVGEAADGTPFLVMPLLAGESLDRRLERGPLGAGELRRVARDAACGLLAAHDRGLIHRDIKPSNLWLEAGPDAPFRRVRLLDFGLAKPTAHEGTAMTHANDVLGTPLYMSPEQARAGVSAGPPADLWSLGAVLYRAAAGRPPFPGDSAMAVLTALAVDDPTPLRSLAPGLPADLAALVHDLLNKRPEARPTAAEMLRRLGDADDTAPVNVDDTVTAPLPAAPSSRRRWRAAALAVLLLAAAGVVGAAVVTRKPYPGPGELPSVPSVSPAERALLIRGAGDYFQKVAIPDGASYVWAEADVTLVIRDKDGKEVQRVTLPDGGKLTEVDPQTGKEKPVIPAPVGPDPVRRLPVLPESGKPLSPQALTQDPPVVKGFRTWTVETTRHRDKVMSLAFSPDGKRLAVGGYDSVVRVYDAATMKLEKALVPDVSAARWAGWTADGAKLVTAGDAACVWEYATGKLLQKVSFSTGGTWVPFGMTADASALYLIERRGTANSGVLYRLDLRREKLEPIELAQEMSVQDARLSLDGRRLAVLGSAGDNQAVRVVDPATGKLLVSLHNGPAFVYGLAWSPDSERVAYHDTAVSRVRVYDFAARKRDDLPLSATGVDPWLALYASPNRLAFVPGGGSLLGAGPGDKVARLDLTDPKAKPQELPLPVGSAVAAGRGHFAGVDTRRRLVVCDAAGKLVKELDQMEAPIAEAGGRFAPPAEPADVVIVAQTDAGQVTLSVAEFEKQTGWSNAKK